MNKQIDEAIFIMKFNYSRSVDTLSHSSLAALGRLL